MAGSRTGFEQLTWDDLTTWAGAKILSRGKSYKNQVRDLRLREDGGVLAWVDGTAPYATTVKTDSSGMLSAICSCPYAWTPCKHSVALVLAYLDALKAKRDVPQVSTGDRRLKLLNEAPSAADEDDEIDSDFEESERETMDNDTVIIPTPRSAKTGKRNRTDVIRQRLESMSGDQLVEFVINLTREYPEIGEKIEEEEELKNGRVTKIIKSVRFEIKKLASESAWRSHWSGEGSIPDYSRVRERLQSLLNSDHADEVVELGKDLWRLGNEQVGQSDDEGETGYQIAECMGVVLQAVSKSSLKTREKILWIIDLYLSDEYGLLDDFEDCLDELNDKSVWSEVADILLSRLDALPTAQKKNDFSTSYRRQQIMDWAVDALQQCGRDVDIIPLLQREAPITQCYGALVEQLLAEGRRTEAEAAAVDGFRQTIDSSSGIAWSLETKLCSMAQEDKNLPLVAAYRALEFFNRPSLESYKTLEQASKAVGQWHAAREAAIGFLETGKRPELPEPGETGAKVSKYGKSWPLPDTEISVHFARALRHYFPDISTLVSVAIYEKDIPAVLRWYEMSKKAKFIGPSIGIEVAEAVKKSHPDLSLEIWRSLAEAQIRLVKPAAYEVAAKYLRKMRDVYEKTQRLHEWTALIRSIRAAHKPKRSLMQILDSLEAKRIIDT